MITTTCLSLTFVGDFEAQGTTGVVCFEVEPHLVTGADHQVGCGGAGQPGTQQNILHDNRFQMVVVPGNLIYTH